MVLMHRRGIVDMIGLGQSFADPTVAEEAERRPGGRDKMVRYC
jgi:hypothetical protein